MAHIKKKVTHRLLAVKILSICSSSTCSTKTPFKEIQIDGAYVQYICDFMVSHIGFFKKK
jgi:hypothetical protein